VDEIGEWVIGKRSDLFHGIIRRHGMLRKFSPALLDALELTQDVEGEQSACLRALQMLKELNASGRRKLPEDAPTNFLSQRLKPMACQIYSGAILIRSIKEGYTIKGNYLFTACVPEEPAEQIGMIGLREHTLQQKGYIVDAAVSCESTSLKLYLGHRGRVELHAEICGVTAHASAPWLGLNAVNKATKFVDAVEARYAGDIRVDPKLGKSSIALTIMSCSPGAMCIVPDRCNIVFDRRLVPTETPEDAVREIQEIIDRLEAEDPDFHASVKISAVPRKTYTGKTVTIPNIKQGWRIEEEHPFVKACADALASLGEPVGYGYWNFGTDLALLCGKHKIPAVGYSPMQELYCHRPVDRIRTDFMDRAVIGNVAIFQHLAKLPRRSFDCHKTGIATTH